MSSQETRTAPVRQASMSTGTGIAIAGIWLACTGLAVMFMLIVGLWAPGDSASQMTTGTAWAILIALVAPFVVAYSISTKIINKKAD